MPSDAQTFIEQFRGTGRTLDNADRERLADDGFHDAVCRAIYAEDNPSDRALIVQLVREEMLLRRTNGCHSGDRVILCALLLALLREVSDVPLLWEAKHTDFDMGCYFDIQLLVFSGVEATLAFLSRQSSKAAREALEYLEKCQAAGDFDDMDGYVRHKLDYYRLPHDRAA